VPPVRYELDFYVPEEDILHNRRRENLKSYIALTGWALYRRRNMFPVKYELGYYIPEYSCLHSCRRENLKSFMYPHIVFTCSEAHSKTNKTNFVALVRERAIPTERQLLVDEI
jgi:hypothetical protein